MDVHKSSVDESHEPNQPIADAAAELTEHERRMIEDFTTISRVAGSDMAHVCIFLKLNKYSIVFISSNNTNVRILMNYVKHFSR